MICGINLVDVHQSCTHPNIYDFNFKYFVRTFNKYHAALATANKSKLWVILSKYSLIQE